MDPDILPLIILILAACAGLLLVARLGTRLVRDRLWVGPARGHIRVPAKRQRTVPPIVGPSGTIVVGPVDDGSLVIGPAPVIEVGPSPDEPVLVGPMEQPALIIGPAKALVVEPPPRGAWDERGWTLHNENGHKVYEGYYQVTHRHSGQPRRFRGRVIVNRRRVVPYIADPPPEVKRHPKGPCFTLVNMPWFRVRWYRPAGNVDDAILYVEKILDETLNRR